MKKGVIALLVVGGVVLLFAMVFGGVYNKLVQGEERVTSSWAQVENVYQRRADLVPNLVQTVKGYAAHERQTLEAVVNARAKATQTQISPDVVNNPQMLAKFSQVQGELSSALSRLMVVVERYPDLKASQNFLALQTQLEGTENRISVERRRFNEAARQFNTTRRVFPNIIIASVMGFKEKAYFEAIEGAETAPKVEF